jgi:hypothetical protein
MHSRTKRLPLLVLGGLLGVQLLIPDFSTDTLLNLTLLFSPFILALLAICCDFLERPELPWTRRIPVALLLTNALFFLSLGYLGSKYLSDFTLYNDVCELGALITIAQVIGIALMKGTKWKTRTFSLASAVVLSAFWHLSKVMTMI